MESQSWNAPERLRMWTGSKGSRKVHGEVASASWKVTFGKERWVGNESKTLMSVPMIVDCAYSALMAMAQSPGPVPTSKIRGVVVVSGDVVRRPSSRIR